MTKQEILDKYGEKICKGISSNKAVFNCMGIYATEFGKFLLQNAMFQQRGKLYLKFTNREIEQIINDAMKSFENGTDTKSTV